MMHDKIDIVLYAIRREEATVLIAYNSSNGANALVIKSLSPHLQDQDRYFPDTRRGPSIVTFRIFPGM